MDSDTMTTENAAGQQDTAQDNLSQSMPSQQPEGELRPTTPSDADPATDLNPGSANAGSGSLSSGSTGTDQQWSKAEQEARLQADMAAYQAARNAKIDAEFRQIMRRNLRWLMAELDHTKEGRSESERAELNP